MAEGLFCLCCLWFFLGCWGLPVGSHPNADSQGVGLQAPRRSLLGPLGCLVLWSRRCLTWPTTCKSPSVPAPVWSPLTLEGVPPGNVSSVLLTCGSCTVWTRPWEAHTSLCSKGRRLFSLLLSFCTLTVWAVPARPSVYTLLNEEQAPIFVSPHFQALTSSSPKNSGL